MALTTTDKLGIASLGMQGAQGLLAGMDNSGEERDAQARSDAFLQLLLQNMQQQGNLEQDLSGENLQRALAFASANPLGAEQNFEKRNTLGLAGLEALSGRQLARGTPSLASGFTDRPGVRDAYSDANVDEAIRQRRIATAGLNPSAQMEIGGAGSDYASQLFGDLQNSQNARRTSVSNQADLINEQRAMEQQNQGKEKQGDGFWKKFAKVAIPVAAVAAAPFTGGGSLGLMALGAGAGAATGALSGGWKGAGIGALTGGASGFAGSKLGAGKAPGAPSGAGFEGNTDFISQNILKGGAGSTMNAGVAPPSGLFNPLQPNRSSVTPPTMGLGQPLAPQVNRPATGGLPNFNPAQPQVGFPSNIGDRRTTGPQPSSVNPIQQALSSPPPANFMNAQSGMRGGEIGQAVAQMAPGIQGANPQANINELDPWPISPYASMPLVQSGVGLGNINRMMQTVGNADPQNQAGRAGIAGLLASLIGGGAGIQGPNQLGLPSGPQPAGLLGSGQRMLPPARAGNVNPIQQGGPYAMQDSPFSLASRLANAKNVTPKPNKPATRKPNTKKKAASPPKDQAQ